MKNKVQLFVFAMMLSMSIFSQGTQTSKNVKAETPTVTTDGLTVQGNVNNMFDNDNSTYCSFSNTGVGRSFTIDYHSPIELTTLKVHEGNNADRDLMQGSLFYSLDGTDFIFIDNLVRGEGYYDFTSAPINAQYLRFYDGLYENETFSQNTGSWMAFKEISINVEIPNFIKQVSTSGLVLASDGTAPSNMPGAVFDGNDNTHAWFYRPALNDYLQIDLQQETDINTLRVLNGRSATDNNFDADIYYSLDGTQFNKIATLSSDENFFSFNETIKARYLRFVVTKVSGWVAMREVTINPDLPEDFIGVTFSDDLAIYQGSPNNVIDQDDTTHLWFNSAGNIGSYVQLQLKEAQLISSIRISNGKGTGGDYLNGVVEYSLDGNEFIEVGELPTSKDAKYFDLVDQNIVAKYIRLRETSKSGWIAVSEVTINAELPMEFSKAEWNEAFNHYSGTYADLFDKNLETYVWFDWKFTNEAYLIVDLRQVRDVKNVVVLLPVSDDNYFSEEVLNVYASIDGESYAKIGEGTGKEIVLNVENCQARYIKLTPELNGQASHGVKIYEVAINYNFADVVFSGENFYELGTEFDIPTATINEGELKNAEVVTTMTKNGVAVEEINKNEIGTYEITVSILENGFQNAKTFTKTFKIGYQAVDILVAKLDSLNTCEDYLKASEIRQDYENLTSEMKTVFNETLCADNNECTQIEKLEYMEYLSTLHNTPDSSSNVLTVLAAHQEVSVVIVVIIFTVLSFALYTIIKRKKLSR